MLIAYAGTNAGVALKGVMQRSPTGRQHPSAPPGKRTRLPAAAQ